MPLLLWAGAGVAAAPPFEGETIFPGQLPLKWKFPGAPFSDAKWTFGGHTAKLVDDVDAPEMKWALSLPRLVMRRPQT